VIFSNAVGTGLRESEIIGLDVADVSPDGRRVRRTIQLRVFKRAGDNVDPRDQRVHLPDATLYKVEKWLKIRRRELSGENFGSNAPDHLTVPLFAARTGARLSDRRLRELFHEWQAEAKLETRYNFHALRHYFVSEIRRRTGDIRIAQVAARHRNIATTARYDHPTDDELIDATRKVRA
jgi:integrase